MSEQRRAVSALQLLAAGLIALAVLVAARPANASYCSHSSTRFKGRIAFTGITDPYVEDQAAELRNCSFGLMAADNIGTFRGGLSWAQTQYPDGAYDFNFFDGLVADLANHHMRFLPVLLDPPRGESTQPVTGAPLGMYPPRSAARFALWAAACARRYGSHGSFWVAHPKLPYFPVTAWEVWNEPNLRQFWAPRPDARAYAQLLTTTYLAIKRVDRRATVLTAGMPFNSVGGEESYLTSVFRDGARHSFDGLALHPYASTVSGAVKRLTTGRTLLDRNGLRRTPIWATEWAWAGGPPNSYVTNAGGQRRNVAGFMERVLQLRGRLHIAALDYYGWLDVQSGPGAATYWAYNLGLYFKTELAKPVVGAFSKIARHLNA